MLLYDRTLHDLSRTNLDFRLTLQVWLICWYYITTKWRTSRLSKGTLSFKFSSSSVPGRATAFIYFERLAMPESFEDNNSSCSGTTLRTSDTEFQSFELDSDYVPSETSEDRAFVASDNEELSSISDGTCDSNDPIQSILDDYLVHGDDVRLLETS